MSQFAALFVLLAVAVVLWRLPRLRGTTLIGPAMWLLVALAALGMFEWLRAAGRANDSLRLLLTSLALCPAISLVGAKRPQDKAWHFIVMSLWIVIALPALQTLVLTNRESPETHVARAWFLFVLMAFATANSCFSRFWSCVLLAGFGTSILLAPYLPYPLTLLARLDPTWGVLSYSSAAILAVAISLRSPRADSSLDQLWRDFRDGFGLLWTLRVAERINVHAQAHGWNISAGWQGIEGVDMSTDESRLFRQNLSNLLRRFVNEDWISRRLDVGE